MLSRVADNLFWMNRYVERAESMSRMVEVNLDTQLEGPDHFLGKKFWNPAIQALSAIDFFKLEETERVEMFFLFSKQWPSSTQNCILSARENARMVRDQLSEEIWVELNSIYHFFQSGDAEKQYLETPRQFFKRIIRFSLVFQGLSDATVHHDEGWRFMSLGKYLERADQTSRSLDALAYKDEEPSRTDLIATLRTCSALSAYRKQFRGELSLGNVADFLLFSQDFPRSLRFAIRRIDTYLHEISGVPSGNFSNEAERLAGSALAKVNFTNINTMLEVGLHPSIDELQCLLIELGQRIFESYVMLPFTTESMSVKAAAQAQVQQ